MRAPLPNRRVLVTRAPRQAGELASALRAVGLEPVMLPTLAFQQPDGYAPLDAALAKLGTFDWLVVTSVNAVEALAARLIKQGIAGLPHGLQVAAVGGATGRRASAELGCGPALLSPEPIAEALAEALLSHAHTESGRPARFLIVRAQEGREIIENTLFKAGAEVTVAPSYRTVAPAESLAALERMVATGDWPAAATFTSPSSARNLLALLEQVGASLPESVLRVAIGPVTSRALTELDLPPHAEAEDATPAAMADAVSRILAARGQTLA